MNHVIAGQTVLFDGSKFTVDEQRWPCTVCGGMPVPDEYVDYVDPRMRKYWGATRAWDGSPRSRQHAAVMTAGSGHLPCDALRPHSLLRRRGEEDHARASEGTRRVREGLLTARELAEKLGGLPKPHSGVESDRHTNAPALPKQPGAGTGGISSDATPTILTAVTGGSAVARCREGQVVSRLPARPRRRALPAGETEAADESLVSRLRVVPRQARAVLRRPRTRAISSRLSAQSASRSSSTTSGAESGAPTTRTCRSCATSSSSRCCAAPARRPDAADRTGEETRRSPRRPSTPTSGPRPRRESRSPRPDRAPPAARLRPPQGVAATRSSSSTSTTSGSG